MNDIFRIASRLIARRANFFCGARGVLAALVLMIVAGAPRARGADLVKGEIVSVGIGGVEGKGGIYRAGAWVPVRVRLENRSGKQLVCRLGVEQVDLDGDKVLSAGEPVILDAADVNGREAWLYYWPRPDDDLKGAKSVVVLDETGTQVLATLSTLTSLGGGGEAVGIGPRDETNQRSSRFVVVLGPSRAGFSAFDGSYGGTQNVVSAWAQHPTDLPDNVLGLDGVDVIVWEADHVHPSELPADFQLKALLQWVRAGGHLIVSVSAQGQDFLKSGTALRDAMPMTFTGVRELKLDDLRTFPGAKDLTDDAAAITQITGTPRRDARAVDAANGGAASALNGHPLAVTGIYGQGAVTVVTVDVANPEMALRVSDHNWILFWNQIAGWKAGQVFTRAEYDDEEAAFEAKRRADAPVNLTAEELHVGDDVPRLVDFTEITQRGLLVAVLFLGLYWLAAGPVGHLVLKTYKVVQWSWWIFGATVLVAAGVAGAIVMFLQLTSYNLRHKTIVLGTVNSPDVTAVGYYGVFAPASGAITVSQPASPAGDAGLNYLAPMCMPTFDPVKPFADPQRYALSNETPNEAAPIFRNTLKKMQGRWTGLRAGIDGTAAFAGASKNPTLHPLAGSLTNHSGYDLDHVEFLVHYAPYGYAPYGFSYLYRVDGWKNGATIDLAAALQREEYAATAAPILLQDVLQTLAAHFAQGGGIASTITGRTPISTPADAAVMKDRTNDLLYLLLDARRPDSLTAPDRIEPIRTFARTTDCTQAFYAAGAMIVARAGDIDDQRYVPSPVPITVHGRGIPGKGEVLFAWMLPIDGPISAARALPNLSQPPASPASPPPESAPTQEPP